MANTPRRRIPGSIAAALLGGVSLLMISETSGNALVLYNSSPSVPVGFYARSMTPPALGAFVTVHAADVAPAYAAARGFADPTDRFIKRVAAAEGDHVCATRTRVFINRQIVVVRRKRDAAGRALPAWSGCRTLGRNEALLLGDGADSFDGRYWGPVSLTQIDGVWRPIRLQFFTPSRVHSRSR